MKMSHYDAYEKRVVAGTGIGKPWLPVSRLSGWLQRDMVTMSTIKVVYEQTWFVIVIITSLSPHMAVCTDIDKCLDIELLVLF